MKIVVDTNILVSSLLSSANSTVNRLLEQIRGAHMLVVSPAMAVELGAVIVRPKFSRLGTEKERVAVAQALLSAPHVSAIVPPFSIVHPNLLDVDDNRLLELAIAAKADVIITGDKPLLNLGWIRKPRQLNCCKTPRRTRIPSSLFSLSPRP
jgi:putative PIN family toxin of toxin-antitoxin system